MSALEHAQILCISSLLCVFLEKISLVFTRSSKVNLNFIQTHNPQLQYNHHKVGGIYSLTEQKET